MAFADKLKILDGERLSIQTKATVQSSGRLNFMAETSEMMGITENSTVILFSAGERDLGAIVVPGADRRGFKAKKSGPYYYISLKNYLEENGIQYKTTRIVYDITRLDEEYEGHTLFKMARRDISHAEKVLPTPDSLKSALSGDSQPKADADTPQPPESAPEAPLNA